MKRKTRLAVWITLTVLILSSLACVSSFQLACKMRGGTWRYDAKTKTEHCEDSFDFNDESGFDSDISSSEEEQDTDRDSPSVEGGDGWIKACLVDPDSYMIKVRDLKEQSGSNKRTCNAKGTITNLSDQDIMYTAYRVNHYGAEDNSGEGWTTTNYQILKPGKTAEYGYFFHCLGGSCGEGEWQYIQQVSLLYYTEDCQRLVQAIEEKPPQSIIEITNPCGW